MSESSDTSAIDEKKEESTSSNKGDFFSSIGGFITLVVIIFVSIIVYYTGSGLILYACKLAQSNILPTDIHCSPYTDLPQIIDPIETNIFTTEGDDPLSMKSMKLKFPYDEYNSKNYILDMIRKYKNEPRSNFLASYLISMIEAILHFNYSAFNTILDMLNGLPEIFLVIFGPVIVAFISTLILIADHVYLIYLWFAQMGWFFKTNSNDSGTGNPKWEDVTLLSPFSYWFGIVLVISFCILFFFSLPFISTLSLLSMLWCLFSCFSYKAEMGGKAISKLQIIRDVFKYYKSTIMGIFSFSVIVSAFSYLGTIPGIFSILVLGLIYFGIIAIDLFNPPSKENFSLATSFIQAKKTCILPKSAKEIPKKKHSYLYNLFFGQSGGSITKEIKEIGKKLSRN
jgi:hypothetical protein